MELRMEQNSNERLARMAVRPDTEAVHMVVNDSAADAIIQAEKVSKFNQAIDELQNRFQEQIDQIQEAGQKISADLQNIEIMPLTSYVLISPFKTNPFQKITRSDSGLITDLGGIAPQYRNQENGQIEEETQFVKVGTVTETGTECKFVQPGDIVIYNAPSEVSVPFFKFGFVAVAEQRIIAVVNEGLTARKNEIMSKKDKDA